MMQLDHIILILLRSLIHHAFFHTLQIVWKVCPCLLLHWEMECMCRPYMVQEGPLTKHNAYIQKAVGHITNIYFIFPLYSFPKKSVYAYSWIPSTSRFWLHSHIALKKLLFYSVSCVAKKALEETHLKYGWFSTQELSKVMFLMSFLVRSCGVVPTTESWQCPRKSCVFHCYP